MRVLAAILAHARDVSLDVSWIQRGLVEWRIEQLDQARVAPYQALVQGIHRHPRSSHVAGARQHGPTLRDRIDRALGIRPGAEERTVVEPGAPIPGAVPGVLGQVAPQVLCFAPASLGKRLVIAALREVPE